MKIITVLGTRPEFIRLSLIIRKLDCYFGKDHILVDTGQNFDYKLNGRFQEELEIRKPDYSLGVKADDKFDRIGQMLKKLGEVFDKENPDYLLVLGDTYTSFSSTFVARHFRKKNPEGMKVFHLEAGNRSFDKRVPEETNRIIIDNISNYNLCYTERSKENLYKEGIKNDVFVMGNPINEVMNFFKNKIDNSAILDKINVKKKDYILVTLHREENVTDQNSLHEVFKSLNLLSEKYGKKVIFSTHPKARDMLNKFNILANDNVIFSEPFGFLDYVKLQCEAICTLSDSGTITEEASILNFPALNLREVHERPEGFEEGAVMMVGHSFDRIIQGLNILNSQKRDIDRDIKIVADYDIPNVSLKVLRIRFLCV
jgi:UDP-N-acetylglucosamine 2-epimerase (non-hydrolysing)